MTSASGVFGRIEAAGAEHVAFCHDPAAGLRALVVIGSTVRGPALCGVRIQPYADADAALDDGLRLTEVMTVKSAAADVRLGGGSVIVLADPRTGKGARLLSSLARQLSGFRGRVLAVNDAGSTAEDIAVQGAGNVESRVAELLRQENAHVLVSDIDTHRADRVAAATGAQALPPGELLEAECDVLCPCALGGVITGQSARILWCSVV